MKWKDGYSCRKCGHIKYQERKDVLRCCNICSHIESPTANMLFHKLKFGLQKAFFICFEMSTTTKSLSTTQTGVRFGIREKSARLFMQNVREAMKSSENYLMDGDVRVDEFVIGGKEDNKPSRSYNSKKKKTVCAVQQTKEGKVKRFSAMKIDDFSAKSLRPIFDKHISGQAKITTDEWKGYKPITTTYNITQI